MTIKIKATKPSTSEEREALAHLVQMKKENNEFVSQLIESIPAIQKKKEKDYDEVQRQIEELIEKRSELDDELRWYKNKLSWLEDSTEMNSTLFEDVTDIHSMIKEDYLSNELLEKNKIAKSYQDKIYKYSRQFIDDNAYYFKLYKAIRPFYKTLNEDQYWNLWHSLNYCEEDIEIYYDYKSLPFNFDMLEIELNAFESKFFSEDTLKKLNARMHLYLTAKELNDSYDDDEIAEFEAMYQNELKEQS